MENKDFRSLLETDKSLLSSVGSTFKKKKKIVDGAARKLKYSKKDETEADELKDGYRNRAADRRAEKGEYSLIAQEWKGYSSVSVEQSKYMGGDLEHTHLVKGLDEQLLEKVKSEILSRDREEALKMAELAKTKSPDAPSFTSILGKKIFKIACAGIHPQNLTFNQKLQKIQQAIYQGKIFKGNSEMFLPGRTNYVYDLVRLEMPKVLNRSKDDCPKPKSGMVFPVHPKVISSVQLSIQQGQERKKKLKKKDKTNTFAVSAANEEDELFTGAGFFNPTENAADYERLRPPQEPEAPPVEIAPAVSPVNQTNDKVNDISLKISPQAPPPPLSIGGWSGDPTKYGSVGSAISKSNKDDGERGFKSVFKRDDANTLRRDNETRQFQDPNLIPDVYAECYPAYDPDGGGMSMVLDDSDDDQDVPMMDPGRKKQKGAKSKYDFATVEEWSAYQSKREAAPKAAFQYGRKMDDNRVTRRKKGKASEAKQWKQITKMMDDGDKKSTQSISTPKSAHKPKYG
eukprot:GHVL01019347.1.p1 GENE.GHVL01019347.1~~GHVL01019347.1.p1  ORF type:complete len:514 (+),score=134.66 GHVL01019347.1:280-1821(+)